MTILPTVAPEGLARRAALEAAAAAPRLSAREVAIGDVGPFTVAAGQPLPIYVVPLEVLATGLPSLSAAEPRGWRVLTDDQAGLCVVDYRGVDPEPRSAAIRRSGSAELLVRACDAAAASVDAAIVYEPRMLEIGRLGFSAFWLHAENADRFLTLEDEPRSLDVEALFQELGPRARRRLQPAASLTSAAGWSNELGG